MSNQSSTVDVQIMNTEYRVSCPASEREALQDAANQLNDQLQEIRGTSKLLSPERVAVMAALNMTYEYLKLKKEILEMNHFAAEQLQEMLRKVEAALSKSPDLQV